MVLFSALPTDWVPAGLGIWMGARDTDSPSGRGEGKGVLPRLGGVLALLPQLARVGVLVLEPPSIGTSAFLGFCCF